MGAEESSSPDELVQCNVRIPQSLRDEIDDRRATMKARTGQRISRDKWLANAARYALQQHPPSPPGKRTR